jgi:hypothetical protein
MNIDFIRFLRDLGVYRQHFSRYELKIGMEIVLSNELSKPLPSGRL